LLKINVERAKDKSKINYESIKECDDKSGEIVKEWAKNRCI